jgi:hypothetical protein
MGHSRKRFGRMDERCVRPGRYSQSGKKTRVKDRANATAFAALVSVAAVATSLAPRHAGAAEGET